MSGNLIDLEVAVTSIERFLSLLATIPDPRRAEGKLYQLPHVLLFSILAVVSGANSYRGIRTFIMVHSSNCNFDVVPDQPSHVQSSHVRSSTRQAPLQDGMHHPRPQLILASAVLALLASGPVTIREGWKVAAVKKEAAGPLAAGHFDGKQGPKLVSQQREAVFVEFDESPAALIRPCRIV